MPLLNRHRHAARTLLIGLLLLLFLARFVTIGWQRMLKNGNSADGDQGAYLQLGLDLREQGTLTDGTRNPLYPLLLAAFAGREWRYFTYAKFLSFACGLLTVVSTFYIGYRLFDRPTALLATFLLSANMEFIIHSTFVLTEALLVLCVVWAWFAMVQALRQPAVLHWWAAAGLLAGLAYLAKGTGLLVAGSFGVATLLLYARPRGLWLFVAAFCLVALPLWGYNWAIFGHPTFNFATTHQMWMDEWDETFVSDAASMPTIWSYWQTHPPAEAWAREWQGLLDMRFFMLKLLWPTRSLAVDQFYLSGWAWIVWAGLGGALLLAHRPVGEFVGRYRAALLLTGLMSATFYFLFAWYLVIVPIPTRFILPLLPLLLLLLCAGATAVGRGCWARLPGWGRVLMALGGVTLALYIGQWFAYSWLAGGLPFGQNPFDADRDYNSFNEQPLEWTRIGHSSGQVGVLWGPGHSLPAWRHTDRLRFVRFPRDVETPAEFEALLDGESIAYIIVDADMAGRRREVAGELLGVDKVEGDRVLFGAWPEGWALGLVYPDVPGRWWVFRRKPPAVATDVVLGGAIRLAGYDLADDKLRPGGEVAITLYWQSIAPVTTNYTIFTQLLGPDGRLYGQVDRQPLYGVWPTGRWQPGERFVDKFVIPISEAAPPNEYQLIVGLYDLATGRRLRTSGGADFVELTILRIK
jgi:hypothetical protein